MVKHITRSSLKIRESGRSSDFISPSFGFGCLLDCTYCYMKRHRPYKSVDIANNVGDILTSINNHSTWLETKEPNQTDPTYWTYDISCNEDFALHSKYHDWERIFKFFKEHDKVKATLATKIIPENFLSFNPNKKVRIRFSLMPQRISNILEPNTPNILERIQAIDKFIDAGYDVHINYSPIVYYNTWIQDYKELFKLVDKNVSNKDSVFAECIFLTHNEKKHYYNSLTNKKGENLLWKPDLQEEKTSEFGGNNIRYNISFKKRLIESFKYYHSEIIPWNKIRYIF